MSDAPNTPDSKDAQHEAEASEPLTLGPVGQKLADAGFTVTAMPHDARGCEVIGVDRANLLAVAQELKVNPDFAFDLLLAVSGMDMQTHRESHTQLYSTVYHHYLILKTQADAQEKVPSLCSVWYAADWHEREAYDLMGIYYEGHPDLRRILMPNDWIGHPLRKDYEENDPRLVWNRR